MLCIQKGDSMLVVNPVGLDSTYKYGEYNFIM